MSTISAKVGQTIGGSSIQQLERASADADLRREREGAMLLEIERPLSRARLLTDGHARMNYQGPPPRPEEIWTAWRDLPILERRYAEQKLAVSDAVKDAQAAFAALRAAKLARLQP